MRRTYHRKSSSLDPMGFSILVVALVAGASSLAVIDLNNLVPYLIGLFILLTIFGLVMLWYMAYTERKRLLAIQISDVDQMTGVEFEKYLGKILESRDYKVGFTKVTGDYGTDIIARKGDKRISIQAKRYKSPVDQKAIREAVTAMRHYNCNACMVITSSYFTSFAKVLAADNDCVLIDREKLIDWILVFQRQQKKEVDNLI